MEQKTSVISKVINVVLKSPSWPFAWLAPLCHCLSCPEEPAPGTDMVQQGITERKDDLSQAASKPLLVWHKILLAFAAARTHHRLRSTWSRCFPAKQLPS